jgi:hypothetical protein
MAFGLGGGVFIVGFVMVIWAALASEFEKRRQSQQLGRFSHKHGERGESVNLPSQRNVTKWEESEDGTFVLVRTRRPVKGFFAPGAAKEEGGAILLAGRTSRLRDLK